MAGGLSRGLYGDGLAGADFATLYGMRKDAPASEQPAIAPYEHQAFAREQVAQNPLNAIALALGIPLWQVLKLFGGHKLLPGYDERMSTPPSLDQVFAGYRGIGEGLSGLLGR